MDDVHHIMGWVNDPEVLAKFANFKPVTLEEEIVYLEKLLASKYDKTYSVFSDKDEYVGQVSLNKIYWPSRNGRLSIIITKEHRGKGNGGRAIQAILERAWNTYELHKVWLMVRADNLKAQKLYKKNGFLIEGTLVQEYIDPQTKEFLDMIRMYQLEH